MYNIILRNFYKQAEPSLQVVIALAKVGSTFLDREETRHIYILFKITKFLPTCPMYFPWYFLVPIYVDFSVKWKVTICTTK